VPCVVTRAEAIPVLVIATYETGNDRGDVPGELECRAERESPARSFAVPGLDHPLLANNRGFFAMVCGTSSVRIAGGLDSRSFFESSARRRQLPGRLHPKT
jgi:hypothetical protein